MLGKCLWKVHCYGAVEGNLNAGNHWQDPIDAFEKAMECVPTKRDNRHPDKDPILEPHYKLVAIVHKLVERKEIDVGLMVLVWHIKLTSAL
jgi:hypothetical protein